MMPNGIHGIIILMGIVGERRGVPLRFLCASVSLWQSLVKTSHYATFHCVKNSIMIKGHANIV